MPVGMDLFVVAPAVQAQTLTTGTIEVSNATLLLLKSQDLGITTTSKRSLLADQKQILAVS